MWKRGAERLSGDDRAALARIRNKQWSSPAERDALLARLLHTTEIPGDDLAALLCDNDPAVRSAGLELVKKAPREKAEASLLGALSRQSEAIRKKTFETFCSLQEGGLNPLRVRELLSDRRPAVVAETLDWMRQHPNPSLLEMIQIPLGAGSPNIRRRAVAAAAAVNSPASAAAVAQAVQDDDEEVRLGVAKILATFPSDAVLPALLKAAADSSTKVQQTASAGLKTLLASGTTAWKSQVMPLLADSNPRVREFAVRIVASQDPATVVDAFLESFKRVYGMERERAVESLVRIGDRIFAPVLAKTEGDDRESVSLACSVALGMKTPQVLGLCVRLLKGPDWWLRQRAATVLCELKDERTLPHLVELLKDPESDLLAAAAMGNWGSPKALAALYEAYQKGSRDLRLEVIEAFAKISDPRVSAFLQNVAKSDADAAVQDKARRLLAKLTGQEIVGEEPGRPLFSPVDLSSKTRISLDDLLHQARAMDASDLHLAVNAVPHLRIHGIMVPQPASPLTSEQVERMVMPILKPEERERLERRRHVDFCYKTSALGRFRTNIFYQRKGLDAVFRLIPTEIPTLADIGLPESVWEITGYSQGLVLVTGPAGCGKTSTLAAFVDRINRSEKSHILTVEDPIEYVHQNREALINQREVPNHTESFARALRQALREDPDVVMVGELRDLETISLAITASETGHLVFGTLHTTTATGAVDRVIDSYPADQQGQIRQMLAESLKAVIAQTLLPRRDGRGRVAAFEILRVTPNVSGLIRDSKTHQIPSAIQTGGNSGMQSMDSALLKLVQDNLADPRAACDRAIRKEPFEPFLEEEGAA